MGIKGAIFDIDGTLLDSMGAWRTVGSDYMRRRGFVPPDDLDATLLRMSLIEGAEYISSLGVPGTPERLRLEMNEMVDEFYRERVCARAGVPELLRALSAAGVRVCVATATDRAQVEAGLKHTGIARYIERIFTCTELETTKHEALIFNTARDFMGTPTAETWVFEDARHAAETAKRAGFRVCAIFDPSEPDQEGLKAAADVYLTTFENAAARLLNWNEGAASPK